MSKASNLAVTLAPAASVLYSGQATPLTLEVALSNCRSLTLQKGDGFVFTNIPSGPAPSVSPGDFKWGAVGSKGCGLVALKEMDLASSQSPPLSATVSVTVPATTAAGTTVCLGVQAFTATGTEASYQASLGITVQAPPSEGSVPIVAGVRSGAVLVASEGASGPQVQNAPEFILVNTGDKDLLATDEATVTVEVEGLDAQALKRDSVTLGVVRDDSGTKWSLTKSAVGSPVVWTATFQPKTVLLRGNGSVTLQFSGLTASRGQTATIKITFKGVQDYAVTTCPLILETVGPYSVAATLDARDPGAPGFRIDKDGEIIVVIRPDDVGQIRNVPILVTVKDEAAGGTVPNGMGVLALQRGQSGELDWYEHTTLEIGSSVAQTLNLVQQASGSLIATASVTFKVISLQSGSSGADLSNLDLSGVNFDGLDIKGTKFAGAKLQGASFSNAQFDSSTDFSGADLSGANLSSCAMKRVKFSGADLSGADLSGADLSGADLVLANLAGAILVGVKSGGIQKSPKTLPSHWEFIKDYLVGPGADLTSADLTGANLTDVNLAFANLTNATLDQTIVDGAVFTGATLAGASFSSVSLEAEPNGRDGSIRSIINLTPACPQKLTGNISSIGLWGGTCVHSLVVNGTSYGPGGGGDAGSLSLPEGDYVARIEYQVGKYQWIARISFYKHTLNKQDPAINYLKFWPALGGNPLSAGVSTGSCKVLDDIYLLSISGDARNDDQVLREFSLTYIQNYSGRTPLGMVVSKSSQQDGAERNWNDPAFDDSAWTPAVSQGGPDSGPWNTLKWGGKTQPDWLWDDDTKLATDLKYAYTLYFRAAFLESNPSTRMLTITGDDSFTAYLNGTQVATGGTWNKPQQVSVSTALGRNVLAVQVTNVLGPGGLLVELV